MKKADLDTLIQDNYENQKGWFRKNTCKFFSASSSMQKLLNFMDDLPDGEIDKQHSDKLQVILANMSGRDFRNQTGKVFEEIKKLQRAEFQKSVPKIRVAY